MRFDKPRYFRQSMSWVHTWAGLVMGWLLFAVYVTGALSYFRNEITVWMQPELHAATAADDWLPKAVSLLEEKGARAQQWTITPPGPRTPVVGLSYREAAAPGAGQPAGGRGDIGGEADGDRAGSGGGERVRGEARMAAAGAAERGSGVQGEGRQGGRERAPPAEAEGGRSGGALGNAEPRPGGNQGGGQDRNQGVTRLIMDPASGEVLAPRTTAGGNFLYRFHYMLYGMDRATGQWIVGGATMLMFVAIITGVVVHRNIFKDFFTFRPAKGKRSWLDGHNATGVLSLPFHILITFSGLLLLATQLMPWPASVAYNGEPRGFGQEMRGMAVGGGAGQNNTAGDRTGRGERAALTDLRPLYQQAEARWPAHGVGSIVVNNPGRATATVDIRQAFGERLTSRGGAERLQFNGVTGAQIEVPATAPPSATRAVWNVFTAVHEGRFATTVVRWMLFLSGVIGALMIASGLVLWLVSRQKEREALGRLPRGHRFVEVMNVGAVAGLMVAIAAYFWANRFIPADLDKRNEHEIVWFFSVWGLTFVHALVRRHKSAWVEQLGLGAALCLLLPLLNGLTGGAHLGRSLSAGQWQVAGFDLVALAIGGVLLFVAHRVLHYVPKPARAAAGRAAPATAPAPESV